MFFNFVFMTPLNKNFDIVPRAPKKIPATVLDFKLYFSKKYGTVGSYNSVLFFPYRHLKAAH